MRPRNADPSCPLAPLLPALPRHKAHVILQTGLFEPDALYVLDEGSLMEACLHRDLVTDLLDQIDGFSVLAPAGSSSDSRMPWALSSWA